MDNSKFIELYLKLKFKKRDWHDYNKYDLLDESYTKFAYRSYAYPIWVNEELKEAIDFASKLNTKEREALCKECEDAYSKKLNEKYEKNYAARMKRDKKLKEEGKNWKSKLKPGDVVTVHKTGRNADDNLMEIIELNNDNFLGRYLKIVKTYPLTVIYTSNYATKMYKFIESQCEITFKK